MVPKEYLLTSSGAQKVTNLQCTQEEADTRMIFYAVKADLSVKENSVKGRVIIKSKDTDVLVLAIHYHPQMKNVKELWTEYGKTTATKNSHRFIPVHEISEKMSPTSFKTFPSVHSLTGCNFTLGIGKNSVCKLLKTKVRKVLRNWLEWMVSIKTKFRLLLESSRLSFTINQTKNASTTS